MSDRAILITQCLQMDFVKPLGRYDPLPNRLHIGYEESRRLIGDNPEDGLVALTMQWAYRQPEEALTIIHIRDWHDPADPFQKEHLRQFGDHCLAGSEGARFAFMPADPDRSVHIMNSPGLNDFVGTELAAILEAYPAQSTRVGLMGVWTEAKIMFLAYDIRTRYPEMDIAVCSALTASSSRSHHFMALEQLQRLLGVQVFSSVGEFTGYLAESSTDIHLVPPRHAELPKVELESEFALGDADHELVRYLFRDCQTVTLKPLGGGFSGNLVLTSRSVDIYGHQQVPHVVKIGDQKAIAQERTAFERVENVLGNSAPRITEFADLKGRGGLKYRYAAMGAGFSTTLKKIYCEDAPQARIERYLKIVFDDQLGRFYRAATLEPINLLEHYRFDASFAPSVRSAVEAVLGRPAVGNTITLRGGQACPNPCNFYEQDLAEILPLATGSSCLSYVHGDLNGANIIIDAQDNIWLIDFFHTGRSHVLKDLIKLENDLLYIFTSIDSDAELEQAFRLTDILLDIHDLQQPLPDPVETGLTSPTLLRAYATVRLLRSFYPPLVKLDRSPLQVFIGQLRYAAHTLSFDESSHNQKLWALYASGRLSARVSQSLRIQGPLRIDWLDARQTAPGKLGITILPGRRDFSRSLADDISRLQADGVSHILSLVTNDELPTYGVEGLFEAYQKAGFAVLHLPILDQGVCTSEEMITAVKWLDVNLSSGAKVMIHCVGGLGRSGLVAANYLKHKGMNADDAILAVRTVRSRRVLETAAQEDFVRSFSTSG
jgi:protein-tyrosine phosphatase/nicotinamidase-related amidase